MTRPLFARLPRTSPSKFLGVSDRFGTLVVG
jgi:hypothetical protein